MALINRNPVPNGRRRCLRSGARGPPRKHQSLKPMDATQLSPGTPIAPHTTSPIGPITVLKAASDRGGKLLIAASADASCIGCLLTVS
jgi:hypothetical protein